MKRKILTGLAALSLLIGVASTQGCYDVGYPGGGGWGGGGYPTYSYGPSYGPAYVAGRPLAYGYGGWAHDGWAHGGWDRSGFGHDGHEFAGGHAAFAHSGGGHIDADHIDGGHAVAHSGHSGGHRG